MPLPMTQDQVLGILSPCFHAAFLDQCKNRVYVGESIFYAAGLTLNVDSRFSPEWGFMILLDKRFLAITSSKKSEIVISESYFRVGSGKHQIDRRWVDTDRYGKDRFPIPITAKDADFVYIYDYRYDKIEGVTRTNYEINQKNGASHSLTELGIGFRNGGHLWYTAFKATDGDQVCQLLNTAIERDGKLVTEPVAGPPDSGASEKVNLIKALDQLRTAGVLTEQEFEQKKQQLLARL